MTSLLEHALRFWARESLECSDNICILSLYPAQSQADPLEFDFVYRARVQKLEIGNSVF